MNHAAVQLVQGCATRPEQDGVGRVGTDQAQDVHPKRRPPSRNGTDGSYAAPVSLFASDENCLFPANCTESKSVLIKSNIIAMSITSIGYQLPFRRLVDEFDCSIIAMLSEEWQGLVTDTGDSVDAFLTNIFPLK